MAHFAEVIDGIVERVLVVEQEFIDTGKLGPKENWVQTSYNTNGGEHSRGGTPLRKNYAGAGMVYDSDRDAFYHPKPYTSWTLAEETCQWEPPVAYPSDGKIYEWNEETTAWDLIEDG